MERELKSMISEMHLGDTIFLHGAIQAQEFSNYLKSISFLVIPSRIESIPVVFSDALQMGTAVVAMPVGDLEHLIKEFKCGIVAQEVSPEALGLAFKEALTRDNDYFREGIAKAYRQFDTKNAVHTWLNFNSPNHYQEIT
jgi:glycosyltransferase involved in cell wall biosynthesis